MKNQLPKHVSRIDQPEKHNHGYYVRLLRRGKNFSKFFPDRQCQGKRKALTAATKYAKALASKHPRMPRQQYAMIARRPNTSGVIGIVRAVHRVGHRQYVSWRAIWSPAPGKVCTRSFSVNKYGEAKAKRLAIKTRRNGVREMAD